MLLILLIIGSIFAFYGLKNEWMDKEFGLQFFFLILGIILGEWFENGKK